jgi:ABC-type uncharacterized transport system permease subunit
MKRFLVFLVGFVMLLPGLGLVVLNLVAETVRWTTPDILPPGDEFIVSTHWMSVQSGTISATAGLLLTFFGLILVLASIHEAYRES